jgi:flagellar biosynthesis GTPase FlhF
MRVKPVALRDEAEEVEPKKISKQKRKQGEMKGKSGDDCDELKILSEDIAPVFLKKKWEEEARAVKKAKQEFLFSGVPEVLKQQSAALTALEQRPVEIFPKISHVTQAGSRSWRLPYPHQLSLVLRKSLSQSQKINRPKTFSSSLNSKSNVSINSASNRSISLKQASYLEWRFCKDWITRLKEDYSLSFPFFRTLRTLLQRANSENDGDLPWTDAYAPKQSPDILSNNRMSSQQLKNWLNQWKLRAGEEVAASPQKKPKKVGKRKRIASDCTDSEDVAVDETSNSSWNPEQEQVISRSFLSFCVCQRFVISNHFLLLSQLCNCVLLVGPAGCGKTATVYALAEELGYNVLEVNASSRRNGKTVLSHLHEATQSHSLNNNTNAVSSSMSKLFGGAKAVAKPARPEVKTALSLVLFEDVMSIKFSYPCVDLLTQLFVCDFRLILFSKWKMNLSTVL